MSFEDDYPYEERGELIIKWREKWILNGCNWWSGSNRPPPNWDPYLQLKRGE